MMGSFHCFEFEVTLRSCLVVASLDKDILGCLGSSGVVALQLCSVADDERSKWVAAA